VTISHSHKDHNNSAAIEGSPLVLDWPGEFEKMSVRIFGYQSYHDKQHGAERGENVLYKFEMEDMSVLHCGDLGVVPDSKLLDEIGNVDILFIPVGGFYTLDATEAVETIKKIEPSIVIPMHYNSPKLNPATFAQLATVDVFIQKLGIQPPVPVAKLVVKKEDLMEEMKVVVMDIGA